MSHQTFCASFTIHRIFGIKNIGKEILKYPNNIDLILLDRIIENISVNRTAAIVYVTPNGDLIDPPIIVGNKTEGALLSMCRNWGKNCDQIRDENFVKNRDFLFSFDSTKKRSTAIIFKSDGSVRLYCKGATEILLSKYFI